MNEQEKVKLENELYALIYPLLIEHESRGYNAHHKAQSIMAIVVGEMNSWIRLQQPCPACTKGESPHRNCILR